MTGLNKKPLRTVAKYICVLLVMNANAFACFTYAPLVFEDIKEADVIFEGAVLNYDYVGCPKEPLFAECHVLIDVKVIRTFHGENQSEWKLYWGNSIYGIPDNWEYDNQMIFAGKWGDSGNLPVRSGSATTVPSQHPELLQVLQAPCSDPFILPANEETVAKIEALLSAEKENE